MSIEQRVERLERSARRWRAGACACGVALAAAVLVGAQRQEQTPDAPTLPTVDGFTSLEIRFDESLGTRKPTPKIPANWRLVAVANGDKMNANNLWFQDGGGNLHVVSGFSVGGRFILHEQMASLARQ